MRIYVMENMFAAIWGLGIFLFGMLYLEDALKNYARNDLKNYLKRYTSSNLKALLFGATSTALLQSSSVVALISMSFVGAGLMSLGAGIGVIFGANLGTTATSWIIALVGFKVNIGDYAVMILGIGGLLAVFSSKSEKRAFIAKVLVGFGLIFFGLAFIKDSMADVATTVDLGFESDYKSFIYFAIGMGLTALIQSSSASTAVIFSAVYAGIADFTLACFFLVGANVGTTFTAMIGSIGGGRDKKRLALAHLIFNFFGSVIIFFLIPFYADFILHVLGLKTELIMGLSVFHTLFNLTAVIIFFPFIGFLTKQLHKLYKVKEKKFAKAVHEVEPVIAEAALIALKKDMQLLLKESMKLCLGLLNINGTKIVSKHMKVKETVTAHDKPLDVDLSRRYRDLKGFEMELLTYINQIGKLDLSKEETKELNNLTTSLRRIAYGVKLFKDIRHNVESLNESESSSIQKIFLMQRQNIARFFKNFSYILEGFDERSKKVQSEYYNMKNINDEFIENITRLVKEEHVNQSEASTLFNVNSSLYHGAKAYLSVQKLLFQVSSNPQT